MKSIIGSLFVASTILAAEKPVEPSGCNQVQERIVKRISEIRGYQSEQFLSSCKGDTMYFTDTKYPFVFATRPDGTTYICKIAKKDEMLCIDPKSEEMAYEIFKELYKEGKVEI